MRAMRRYRMMTAPGDKAGDPAVKYSSRRYRKIGGTAGRRLFFSSARGNQDTSARFFALRGILGPAGPRPTASDHSTFRNFNARPRTPRDALTGTMPFIAPRVVQSASRPH